MRGGLGYKRQGYAEGRGRRDRRAFVVCAARAVRAARPMSRAAIRGARRADPKSMRRSEAALR